MFNPIWEKFPFNLLVFFDLKHHDIMSGFDSHSCIRNDRDFYKSWNNPLETNYEKRHPHYEPEPTMISGHDFMPSLQRTRNVHSQPWCRRRERPRAREHLQLERQERNPYWCYIWPETRWLGHKPTCLHVKLIQESKHWNPQESGTLQGYEMPTTCWNLVSWNCTCFAVGFTTFTWTRH